MTMKHRKNMPRKYYTYTSDGQLEKSKEPLISVIVPIYNAEQYLDQALSSIENQTYGNLEIICLNDGSTDSSLVIIEAHAKNDSRITIIDKENEGYGATCNRGIEAAHGDWISIIEPDDWIEPTMYANMIAHASNFACDADVIKTPYWRIENPDTPSQRKLNCSYRLRMKDIEQPFTIDDAACLVRHHPSIWSAIYRKSFLDENEIRFHPIPGAGWADNPFLIDTLCRAKNILYVDKPYYCYRADTEEQERDFHKKNPDIPVNRWLEMTDILDSLGVNDADLLKAHYERGFMYVGGVLESHIPDEPDIQKLLLRVFERMDPNIVFADDGISPASKRLFANLLGIEPMNTNMLKHLLYLGKQAAYNMLNVGPIELANSVKRYATKYQVRSGNN